MAPGNQRSFVINPQWPTYLGFVTLALSIAGGLFRYNVLDYGDVDHCSALLSEGSWLDGKFTNWQPEGCMQHVYQSKDASSCMTARPSIFIGDSVTRKLFFQFAHIIDPALPTAPPEAIQKHSDHILHAADGTQLSFYWDPFLNSTHTTRFIHAALEAKDGPAPPDHPALLVLGSGLWYLRYAQSGGLPAWEAQIEFILDGLFRARRQPASEVIILPVEEVLVSKLSPERAETIHSSDIDAMNSDLFHRVRGHAAQALSDHPGNRSRISIPTVFNKMMDASQTEDGLHFSDAVVKAQANILFNLHCNDGLPKKPPFDKTCCRSYPWPSLVHLAAMAGMALSGPLYWYFSRQPGDGWAIRPEVIPFLTISMAISAIYVADRTGLWLKEQKQFDPWTFTFLNLAALAVGLMTMKRADKDLGFLNRDQTDEWKGWMQIAILIYHYVGASKISGIYNPIRVLVAAYLFMTGYGHTTFYVKKADFGFLRIIQILFRLNLFTLVLAYGMNTDYLYYYFAPLVSMWFLIIYGTMAVGSQYNDRTVFLVGKIIASLAAFTWFMNEPALLETLFSFLEHFFGIRWSAREWTFRVKLDLWIVYVGMFAALAVMKIREHRITDHPQWPLAVKVSAVASLVGLIWFFAFELMQDSKFTYNGWHPYTSFVPVLAFAVLRNATPLLRSASSRAFAFIGTCSLETFIIQYHIWLAGDTKGVLLIIPGTRWRPLNMVVTSFLFVFISHIVARATGEITTVFCGSAKKTLPTTNSGVLELPPVNGRPSNLEAAPETIPLTAGENGDSTKEREAESQPVEPDTPIRPGWVDRLVQAPLARQPSHLKVWVGYGWSPGVKTRLALALALMWLVNVLWLV